MTLTDERAEPAAEGFTPTAQKVAAVIYNPIKVDLEAIKALVATEQSDAGWGETLYFETSKDNPGTGAASAALDQGVAMLIVAGGDGTVRAVAEAMGEHDVALALLPSGTGNLLARNLELTLDDTEHSLRCAFGGDDRTIDRGMIEIRRADSSVDRHAYLVMAGIGLDAKMLAHTDDDLKAKVGWLAYLKEIVSAKRDNKHQRMRYRLDQERTRSTQAHTVIVGNCGTLQANVQLLPDAKLDDGTLDIVFLRPEGVVNWAKVLHKVIWKYGVMRRLRPGQESGTDDIDAMNYRTGTRFTIALDRPELIELDGDEFGEAIGFRTWVEPGALTVRVLAATVSERVTRAIESSS